MLLLAGPIKRGALLSMREILRRMQRRVVEGAPAALAVEKVREGDFLRLFLHLFIINSAAKRG